MTREEAVARIKEHIEIHRYHEQNAVKIFEALDMAIKALEQPERKKGKWIPHKEISREYVGAASIISIKHDYWFCDACGYRVEEGQPMYNFCPHCGAEMMNGGNGHVNANT